MNPKSTFSLAVLSLVTSSFGDWMQWRGSLGTGASKEARPPLRWSATENVKWKLAIPGKGSGTPVVAGEAIFVVTTLDTGLTSDGKKLVGNVGDAKPQTVHDFQVWRVNRLTGTPEWKKTVVSLVPHSGYHQDHGYASASPITDGKHVWAHFGSRGTYCLTVEGELVWKRDDLGLMDTRGGFGDGSSPALHQNVLVIPWDHEGESFIIALDSQTGKTLWKKEREEPSSWATPLIVDHAGKAMVIQSGHPFARAYALKTGEELWRASGQTTRPIPTPVASDGMVFIGSGHQGSFLAAYQLDGAEGDLTGTTKEVWKVDRHSPDVPSPVISEGRLYFHAARRGILSCVEAKTGKPFYSAQRVEGLGDVYASPIVANGHVYMTSRDGVTVVIKDAPIFEIVSTNELGESMDASPIAVGEALYFRGAQHLYCIGE